MDAESLKALMWTALRAEGEGVVATGHTGPLPDVRGGLLIEGADLTVAAHNLGVANGIKALLTHMSQNGWRLVGPLDPKIYPPRDGDLGEEFKTWLNTPLPSESNQDRQLTGARGWKDGVYNPALPPSKHALLPDLPEIKGVHLKDSSSVTRTRFKQTVLFMKDGRVHLNGVPIKFSVKAADWQVQSGYSEYPLEIRFQVDGKTYVVSESLGTPYVDRLMLDYSDQVEDPDPGTTYEEPVASVVISQYHGVLQWLVQDIE
jgi:hypothetical protein